MKGKQSSTQTNYKRIQVLETPQKNTNYSINNNPFKEVAQKHSEKGKKNPSPIKQKTSINNQKYQLKTSRYDNSNTKYDSKSYNNLKSNKNKDSHINNKKANNLLIENEAENFEKFPRNFSFIESLYSKYAFEEEDDYIFRYSIYTYKIEVGARGKRYYSNEKHLKNRNSYILKNNKKFKHSLSFDKNIKKIKVSQNKANYSLRPTSNNKKSSNKINNTPYFDTVNSQYTNNYQKNKNMAYSQNKISTLDAKKIRISQDYQKSGNRTERNSLNNTINLKQKNNMIKSIKLDSYQNEKNLRASQNISKERRNKYSLGGSEDERGQVNVNKLKELFTSKPISPSNEEKKYITHMKQVSEVNNKIANTNNKEYNNITVKKIEVVNKNKYIDDEKGKANINTLKKSVTSNPFREKNENINKSQNKKENIIKINEINKNAGRKASHIMKVSENINKNDNDYLINGPGKVDVTMLKELFTNNTFGEGNKNISHSRQTSEVNNKLKSKKENIIKINDINNNIGRKASHIMKVTENINKNDNDYLINGPGKVNVSMLKELFTTNTFGEGNKNISHSRQSSEVNNKLKSKKENIIKINDINNNIGRKVSHIMKVTENINKNDNDYLINKPGKVDVTMLKELFTTNTFTEGNKHNSLTRQSSEINNKLKSKKENIIKINDINKNTDRKASHIMKVSENININNNQYIDDGSGKVDLTKLKELFTSNPSGERNEKYNHERMKSQIVTNQNQNEKIVKIHYNRNQNQNENIQKRSNYQIKNQKENTSIIINRTDRKQQNQQNRAKYNLEGKGTEKENISQMLKRSEIIYKIQNQNPYITKNKTQINFQNNTNLNKAQGQYKKETKNIQNKNQKENQKLIKVVRNKQFNENTSNNAHTKQINKTLYNNNTYHNSNYKIKENNMYTNNKNNNSNTKDTNKEHIINIKYANNQNNTINTKQKNSIINITSIKYTNHRSSASSTNINSKYSSQTNDKKDFNKTTLISNYNTNTTYYNRNASNYENIISNTSSISKGKEMKTSLSNISLLSDIKKNSYLKNDYNKTAIKNKKEEENSTRKDYSLVYSTKTTVTSNKKVSDNSLISNLKNNLNNNNYNYNNSTYVNKNISNNLIENKQKTSSNIIESKTYSNSFYSNKTKNEKINTPLNDSKILSYIKQCNGISINIKNQKDKNKMNQEAYFIEKKINGINNFNIFGILDGNEENKKFQFIKGYIIDQIKNNPLIKSEKDPMKLFWILKGNNYKILNDLFSEIDIQIQRRALDNSNSITKFIILIQIYDHIISVNIGDSKAIIVCDNNGNNLDKSKVYQLSYNNKLIDGKKINPKIIDNTIDKSCKYFIMGSSGLWKFINNDECMKASNQYYLKNDSLGLCKELYRIISNSKNINDNIVDDISIIVGFF